MKEEKKKIQNNFIVAAGLLALFILYTVAIMFVDVQPIGPQGSSVGFAEVNQYFHTLFGVNMLLYSITDWLSIAVLFIMFGFAMVGLVQLIKRKSLFRVDSSILVLGGFYVLVFLAYLFFEFFVVNYRPVLIEGVLEASYPSSTTMLMMCIMPTAIMQFHHLISSKRLRNIVNAFCGIYASFMVIGRVLSGVHWFTDIVGGILLSATLVMLYYSTNQLVNSKASRSSQRSRGDSRECCRPSLSSEKGGFSMTEKEYKEHIQYTHNAYCRIVIRHASIDAARMLFAKWKREISLEYLTEEKFVPLSTTDEYFQVPDYGETYPFSVRGQTILLDSCSLAVALAELPEQTQEEIFLYYFQHLTQKEIGEQSGWTRSTIGRHIQLALKRLKEEMEVLSHE